MLSDIVILDWGDDRHERHETWNKRDEGQSPDRKLHPVINPITSFTLLGHSFFFFLVNFQLSTLNLVSVLLCLDCWCWLTIITGRCQPVTSTPFTVNNFFFYFNQNLTDFRKSIAKIKSVQTQKGNVKHFF